MASMNPWEARAFESADTKVAVASWGSATNGYESEAFDATGVMYPGLYSASGIDIMGILLWTLTRPNPTVNIGPVDCSVPMILCDLVQPDQPIVYASDAFLSMTGYKKSEVIGRNCRFLQAPGGKVKPSSSRKHVDKDTVRKMRKAVQRKTELQIKVTNFRKDGKRFTNFLTMIPIMWQSHEYTHCLGLQCDWDEISGRSE